MYFDSFTAIPSTVTQGGIVELQATATNLYEKAWKAAQKILKIVG